MKTIISTLIILAASVVLANTELPKSLGSTMKSMNSQLNQISLQMSDAKTNDSSAAMADQFVVLTLHAKNFVAETILALPAEQQAAAKAEYDLMLDQTASLGTKLAEAFRANDSVLAKDILAQLKSAKKDGHTKFKQ